MVGMHESGTYLKFTQAGADMFKGHVKRIFCQQLEMDANNERGRL
jgi:hypothetical protein